LPVRRARRSPSRSNRFAAETDPLDPAAGSSSTRPID
jgi:hypothetical protein